MRRWFWTLGIFILLVSSGVSADKVDEEVFSSLNSTNEKVRVIVELKDEPRQNNLGVLALSDESEFYGIDSKKIGYKSEKTFSAEVDLGDLEKLNANYEVASVIKMGKIYAVLQDAVGIVNATPTWNLQPSGINLTGSSQTVCVIDSGINFSHSDLNASYLGGYDFVDDDSDPSDGHGHGTHVAGIVAAAGGITGISSSTGIVAIRVLDDSGGGSPSDLVSAIDWCVNNASQFNISVISMSLGCNGTIDGYTSHCDAISDGCWNAAIANSINAAVANNISVLASSGNYANNTAISSPACIQNATPVSSTDKDDEISSFSDRSSLVKLFAPGASINSTRWNPGSCTAGCTCLGNYMTCSGTSMSAPVVAGAFAIINQYLDVSGQTRTPSEIEDALYDTGLQFNESSNNFSRINIYDAILSLDADSPNVTLVSPINNKVNLTDNQTFVCNATDWQLANMTLQVWNSSGILYYNATNNLTGTSNQTNFNLTNMSEDTYLWNCLAADIEGNSASASANYSLTIGGVSTTLVSPETENHTTINDTNFSCTVSSDLNHELSNVTFYLWNESGNLTYNLTTSISNFTNTSIFNYTFAEEGNFSWNCLGMNNVGNSSWGENNFTINYDITSPNISSLAESVTSSGATITWTTSEVANSSISINAGSWSNSSSYTTSHSVVISGLSVSTGYSYTAFSCDRAGNCVNSSDSFTTSAAPSSPGGGSTSSISVASAVPSEPETYNATVEELSAGYTKSLKKNEKINFSIFDLNGGRHLLTVNNIGVDYVDLTIESDPITLRLGVGQSVKLNLTSENYYDLFIKLENITDGEAELTIKLINEPIEKVVEPEVVRTTTEEGEVVADYSWIAEIISLDVLLAIAVIALIIFAIKLSERESKKLKRRMTLKKK